MNFLAQAPTPVEIGSKFGSPFGLTSQGTVGGLVSLIIRGSFVVAGFILLFYFIGGGLMIIRGAGNDDPKAVGQGKEAITSALIGFGIIFVAYWIIRLIELITATNFITSPFGKG